jgi:outer membrane protein TolC
MKSILPILGISLGLCLPALAQTPAPGSAPLRITLQDAMERARRYSQLTLTANLTALLAHEDTVQSRAALLPSVNGISQFIYTQPNDTPTGVFVSNDGPHVYNNQASAHADIFAPAKRADYHRAMAAEAAARARADLASRGLIATVTQNYYGMAVAARKLSNARQNVHDAQQFFEITQKQEKGGEVAHSDTVKAEIQLNDRQRDEQEAQLTLDKSRIGFAVLLFPDYRQDFDVVDDLDTLPPIPAYPEIQSLAGRSNPDVRAAQAVVQQQDYEIRAARAEMLPTFSLDYTFGTNANQFAFHNPEGQNLLGSMVQAQLVVPLWTWGAARSRVKQAEFKLEQARNDLSFTQRQLLSNLDAFYREASLARDQLALLRHSLDLSKQSLDLTLLRYQAGEVSVLEVVDAQSTLRDARNAVDDGLVRFRVAIANLQTLTGAF